MCWVLCKQRKNGIFSQRSSGPHGILVPSSFALHRSSCVENQLHHFVVLYKVTQKHVFVMDPAFGEMQKYERRDFEEIWSGVLVLMAPGEGFRPLDATKSLLKRFWGLMWPHRSVIFQALLGAVLFTLLGLCMSVYIQKITDYVLVDGNQNLLNVMSMGMLLVIALQAYVGSRKSILMMKSGQLMDAALILGYYKHLMFLPQRFLIPCELGRLPRGLVMRLRFEIF